MDLYNLNPNTYQANQKQLYPIERFFMPNTLTNTLTNILSNTLANTLQPKQRLLYNLVINYYTAYIEG